MIVKHTTVILMIFVVSICACNRTKPSALFNNKNTTEKLAGDSILLNIKGKTKTVVINPLHENKIMSKGGIKFSILANAFVTKTRRPVTAKICVTVSEYHNPADILTAGIRMQYKTSEGRIQMESAGMFAITAESEGEQLQLASGKDIDVQVPSKNAASNFNLYFFDPITNEWIQTKDSLPIILEEPKIEKSTKASSTKNQLSESSTINVEWAAVEANKRVVDGKIITLVKPDCSYKNSNFNFTVSTDKFPELNMYKETIWMGCTKKDENSVAAAFENDELLMASIIERETPLNRYLIAFEFRHIKFTAYMKIASTYESCEENEEIYFSYYDERPVNEEKIEAIKTKVKKIKKQDNIARSFSINQLGLWNCDRLYLLPEKMIITPRFRSITTGEFYESTTTYMIDKNINSVWTFSKQITLNPDSDNIILFVNTKGKICHARLNKLSQKHKEKEINLIIDVKEMSDMPSNTEELNLLLKNM